MSAPTTASVLTALRRIDGWASASKVAAVMWCDPQQVRYLLEAMAEHKAIECEENGFGGSVYRLGGGKA